MLGLLPAPSWEGITLHTLIFLPLIPVNGSSWARCGGCWECLCCSDSAFVSERCRVLGHQGHVHPSPPACPLPVPFGAAHSPASLPEAEMLFLSPCPPAGSFHSALRRADFVAPPPLHIKAFVPWGDRRERVLVEFLSPRGSHSPPQKLFLVSSVRAQWGSWRKDLQEGVGSSSFCGPWGFTHPPRLESSFTSSSIILAKRFYPS